LAADIRRYDDLYYNHRDDDDETGHHNNKMISDEAFDALVVREEQLCRAYPQLLQRLQVDEGLGRQTTRYGGRVGAIRVDRQHNKETTTDPSIAATATDATSTSTTTTTSNGNDRLQRRHGQKMMSLDNVVQREQLDAWMERVAKAVFGSSSSRKSQEEDPIQHETTASITILTEPKLDGLSLSLRYSPNSSDDDDDDDDDNDDDDDDDDDDGGTIVAGAQEEVVPTSSSSKSNLPIVIAGVGGFCVLILFSLFFIGRQRRRRREAELMMDYDEAQSFKEVGYSGESTASKHSNSMADDDDDDQMFVGLREQSHESDDTSLVGTRIHDGARTYVLHHQLTPNSSSRQDSELDQLYQQHQETIEVVKVQSREKCDESWCYPSSTMM